MRCGQDLPRKHDGSLYTQTRLSIEAREITWSQEVDKLGPFELGLVHQADCLDALPLLPTDSVPMIWTDPPYGHGNMDDDLQSARIRDGVKGARKAEAAPILNDKEADFTRVLTGSLREASRILRRDCCCCCCCCGGGPKPTFASVANWMDEALEFFHAVVWDKSARGHGLGWRFRRDYEFIMVAHRKGGKLLWADNAVAVPNVVRNTPVLKRIHPNEKPVSLVRDFISWCTAPGDLVLDPFAGSGTTGVACIELGRKFLGFEQDPQWVGVANDRIRGAGKGISLADERVGQGSLFAS